MDVVWRVNREPISREPAVSAVIEQLNSVLLTDLRSRAASALRVLDSHRSMEEEQAALAHGRASFAAGNVDEALAAFERCAELCRLRTRAASPRSDAAAQAKTDTIQKQAGGGTDDDAVAPVEGVALGVVDGTTAPAVAASLTAATAADEKSDDADTEESERGALLVARRELLVAALNNAALAAMRLGDPERCCRLCDEVGRSASVCFGLPASVCFGLSLGWSLDRSVNQVVVSLVRRSVGRGSGRRTALHVHQWPHHHHRRRPERDPDDRTEPQRCWCCSWRRARPRRPRAHRSS